MDLPTRLRDLIDVQAGPAHRGQLLAGGMSLSALRWHLGRSWRLVLPAVVETFTDGIVHLQVPTHLAARRRRAGSGLRMNCAPG